MSSIILFDFSFGKTWFFRMFNLIFLVMLFATLIGNLGANAEVKTADGREFVSFRVAHNDSYKGADGTKVE